MKKNITLLLSGLFLGVTFAGITPSEQQTIGYVASFLQDNGSLIDQRAGDSQEMQLVAKDLREGLIQEMKLLDSDVDDYGDFKSMLVVYLQALSNIEEIEGENELVEFTQPLDAVLALQNHVRSEVHQGQDIERPIHESTTLAMTLNAVVPFVGQIDGMWNIVGDSKVDLSQQVMESLLAMDMSFSLSSAPTGEEESLAAKGLLDIRMPGNDVMYIGMKDIEIGGTEGEDEMTAFVVEQMQEVLSDTYVSIPLEGGNNADMMYFDTLATRYSLNQYMTEKPFIRFYHKEGNSYYGFFSHDVCDMLETVGMDKWTVGNCHDGIDDVLERANGKGPIVLTMHNGTYELSLHNFDGYMPEYLEDVNVVSWNNQRVIRAVLPFDDQGNGISYQGDERKITLDDEEVVIDLAVENKNNEMTIEGTILADGALVSIDGEFDRNNNSVVGSLVIGVSQGGVDIGEFVFDMNNEVRNIGTFEVEVPKKTLTMDEFTEIMEQRVMEFYLQ